MPSTKNSQSLEAIKEIIESYMRTQYRPYSTNDILLNLRNQVPKQKLGAGLAALVEENKLIVKVVGKTSYYCYKELVSESNSSETALLESVTQMEKELTDVEVEIKDLTTEMRDIGSALSNNDISQNLCEAKEKIKILKSKQWFPNEEAFDSREIKQFTSHMTRAHKRYKSIFNSLQSTLLDITEQKNILLTIGIEESEIKKYV